MDIQYSEEPAFPVWMPLVGLLPVMAVLLSGCGNSHPPAKASEKESPPESVRVETIELRKLALTQDVVGTVATRYSADIAAKISGRIRELPVHLGQSVNPGDLLVAIETEAIQARLEQSEVGLRQAEIDYHRVDTLRQTGAATQSDFEMATTHFHSAQATVAEAKALLDDARITAPIRGVVARKEAEPGDLAMPGRLLLRIEDPSHLRFEADIPSSLFDRIESGVTLPVRVDGLADPLEGKVVELAPGADPATRSLRVKLELPPVQGVRPGQFGRLTLNLAEADFLIVPETALATRGQLQVLFAVVEGKAQMRIVRTGRAMAGGIEILAGLSPGEAVVVEDVPGLVDGQPLRPQ